MGHLAGRARAAKVAAADSDHVVKAAVREARAGPAVVPVQVAVAAKDAVLAVKAVVRAEDGAASTRVRRRRRDQSPIVNRES
jgi:hypothetical protein